MWLDFVHTCAKLKTQWTMHVVISDVQNMQPFMTFVSKYLQKCASFYLLLLRNISWHCAHSKNTTSFSVSSTLFSTPFVLFSCTPFGTKSRVNDPIVHVRVWCILETLVRFEYWSVWCSMLPVHDAAFPIPLGQHQEWQRSVWGMTERKLSW